MISLISVLKNDIDIVYLEPKLILNMKNQDETIIIRKTQKNS